LEWASPIQYLIPLSYQIENFNAMEAPTVEIIVIARKTSLLPLELHKGKNAPISSDAKCNIYILYTDCQLKKQASMVQW
jgi:hypothetical protein